MAFISMYLPSSSVRGACQKNAPSSRMPIWIRLRQTNLPTQAERRTAPPRDQPVRPDLAALENAYVKVFLGDTTFEREVTTDGNLAMLEAAARALGAPRIAQKISDAGFLGADEELKDAVLRTAKRFGKGRFAQVAARHVAQATELPSYIVDAVEWLRAQ